MLPHLSLLAQSDPFVFLSGQLPFDANREISATDIDGQTRQVMANIAEVLRGVGLTLDDIVKTTVWLKHAPDFPGFDAAYAACLGAHKPARSTVISGLVLPTALIEIEAIAARPSAQSAS